VLSGKRALILHDPPKQQKSQYFQKTGKMDTLWLMAMQAATSGDGHCWKECNLLLMNLNYCTWLLSMHVVTSLWQYLAHDQVLLVHLGKTIRVVLECDPAALHRS
jgi:hypothetical protein